MAYDPRMQTANASISQAEIDEGLRSYMLRVYNYMALGVAFTGLFVLFLAGQPELLRTVALGPGKWIAFAAVLGLGWFGPKVMMTKSVGAAHGVYWLYAAAWGVMIAPMVALYLATDPMMVARAFFITSGMFAGASLFGYVTKKDLSAFGRFFMLASIGLLVAMLVNFFFVESSGFALLISFAVVLLFAGITAYETQIIKNMYYEAPGDVISRMAIFGAFMLYGSFVTMFIHTLSILQMLSGSDE